MEPALERRQQRESAEESEQARQSAEDARQAAAELRVALDHALKAATEQPTIMHELRETFAHAKETSWDR